MAAFATQRQNWMLQQKSYGPLSLKYLLSGPLWKKFTHNCIIATNIMLYFLFTPKLDRHLDSYLIGADDFNIFEDHTKALSLNCK